SPPRPAKRRDSRLQHKIRRTGSKLGRPKNKGDPFPSRLCIIVFWVCLLSRTDNTRLDTRSIVSRFPPATFRKARSIGTSIYNRAVARRLASITALLALMQAFFMAPFQPESPVHIFAPAESFVWVEVTEPCGHDPPCIENTIPRAPPF